MSASCARSCATSARATATWRRATCAPTSTFGPPPRRAARHALRDQERQLDPLHRPGDRGRGAPPDRRHRGRRRRSSRRRACSIRRAARRARCARRKRRTTIAISPIPICCRSNSTRRGSTRSPPLPELPDAKKARFIAEYGLSRLRRADARRRPRERRLLRSRGQARRRGARRQGGRQLDHGRSLRLTPTPRASASPRRASSAAALATLVDLIGEGVISGKIAKDLLAMLLGADKGADPRALVEARGLGR